MSWTTSGLVVLGLCMTLGFAQPSSSPMPAVSVGAQAAATVGYFLLWVSVELGLLLHARWHPHGLSRSWLLEAHRISSTLAFAFLLGHIWGLLIDPLAGVGGRDAFVPFAARDHVLARAAGSLSLWTLTAVLATTALAGRIPSAAWRKSHLLAFPAYGLALLHGVAAGPGMSLGPSLGFYLVTGGLALSTWLLLPHIGRPRRPLGLPRAAVRTSVARPPALALRPQRGSAEFERVLRRAYTAEVARRDGRWPGAG